MALATPLFVTELPKMQMQMRSRYARMISILLLSPSSLFQATDDMTIIHLRSAISGQKVSTSQKAVRVGSLIAMVDASGWTLMLSPPRRTAAICRSLLPPSPRLDAGRAWTPESTSLTTRSDSIAADLYAVCVRARISMPFS